MSEHGGLGEKRSRAAWAWEFGGTAPRMPELQLRFCVKVITADDGQVDEAVDEPSFSK